MSWPLAAGVALGFYFRGEGPSDERGTLKLAKGEFLVTEVENGQVQAIRGDVVMSPAIGGELKIIHLWLEGARVDVGNLVIQFGPTEFEREMLDEEGQR